MWGPHRAVNAGPRYAPASLRANPRGPRSVLEKPSSILFAKLQVRISLGPPRLFSKFQALTLQTSNCHDLSPWQCLPSSE